MSWCVTLVLVIAHRGASGWAPENTIPAFQKAAELEADMIEFDIQLSAGDYIEVWTYHNHGANTDVYDQYEFSWLCIHRIG